MSGVSYVPITDRSARGSRERAVEKVVFRLISAEERNDLRPMVGKEEILSKEEGPAAKSPAHWALEPDRASTHTAVGA
eukprot:scaffold66500_cov35-Tisochrysis_lutea.AAC.1